MARPKAKRGSGRGSRQPAPAARKAVSYRHPEATGMLRPDVGTQAQFRRRKRDYEDARRLTPGTEATTPVLGGTAREIAEHKRIQEITGGVPARKSDSVSNKVDPIGAKPKTPSGREEMKVEDATLPVPPAVSGASKAMEMARIWLVDGDQQVVLSPNLWKDSAAWGLMLVDLARHVASAYEAQGHDRAEVLRRIREAFEAEWGHPTDSSPG